MSQYDMPPQFVGVQMSKYNIRLPFECQVGFRMSKYNIRPQFECRNRFSNIKYDIQPQFKCRNRGLNIKIRYSASVRMSQTKSEKRKTKTTGITK